MIPNIYYMDEVTGEILYVIPSDFNLLSIVKVLVPIVTL